MSVSNNATTSNFEIINIDDRSFTIRFIYNGKTYQFTPSRDSVTVS